MAEAPPRHLPLAGTYNVRDVGGYGTADGRRTRWGALFRADSMHRLPTEVQADLVGSGLRTVVDLRREPEVAAQPNVFATSPDVRYLHLPLLPDRPAERPPGSLEELYRSILRECQPQLRRVLAVLAEPEALPALVHCTAGKDRTGLIVGLLLALVGVPRQTIAEDYALSATYLVGHYLVEARERALAGGHDWEQYQGYLVCPPELMLRTLDHLDERYGGIDRYALAIGLVEREIDALRDALVAPA